jgi:hypothetical protein
VSTHWPTLHELVASQAATLLPVLLAWPGDGRTPAPGFRGILRASPAPKVRGDAWMPGFTRVGLFESSAYETMARMTEYHEQFWVIIGTTSPVIALANAVTASRGAAIAGKVSGLRSRTGYYRISDRFASGVVVISLISLLISIFGLAVSLWSLAGKADRAPLMPWIVLMTACIVALGLQVFLESFVAIQLPDLDKELEEAIKREQASTGESRPDQSTRTE